MLHNYVEIFSWSYKDMPGLDTDIVVHRLPMKEGCAPTKQKVCRMRPEMLEKIKVKVINMGTEADRKEVKIGANLEDNVKN